MTTPHFRCPREKSRPPPRSSPHNCHAAGFISRASAGLEANPGRSRTRPSPGPQSEAAAQVGNAPPPRRSSSSPDEESLINPGKQSLTIQRGESMRKGRPASEAHLLWGGRARHPPARASPRCPAPPGRAACERAAAPGTSSPALPLASLISLPVKPQVSAPRDFLRAAALVPNATSPAAARPRSSGAGEAPRLPRPTVTQ